LDANLTTLVCKKVTVMKTGCNLVESSKEGHGAKWAVFPMMTMMKVVKGDEG
jgi:hypothetical protein